MLQVIRIYQNYFSSIPNIAGITMGILEAKLCPADPAVCSAHVSDVDDPKPGRMSSNIRDGVLPATRGGNVGSL